MKANPGGGGSHGESGWGGGVETFYFLFFILAPKQPKINVQNKKKMCRGPNPGGGGTPTATSPSGALTGESIFIFIVLRKMSCVL